MSCYFRYMKDVIEEAGLGVNTKNKKEIDQFLHDFVDTEYKNCWKAWPELKILVKEDKAGRKKLIAALRKNFAKKADRKRGKGTT